MKLRKVVIFIALIIIIDQALKIWIKTNYPFGPVAHPLGFKWFELYFIENKGMAWGWEFGGEWGKMALTLFRLAAVIFGTWYLGRIVKQKYHRGFIICASLIYAGALGNLIDSMFYGMIFEESGSGPGGYVAKIFPEQGYAGFLHGRVVDMLHFEFIDSTWPTWVPWIGGDRFQFFGPIFNIADAAISTGVITLFIFQKKFFRREVDTVPVQTSEVNKGISDNPEVL
ncbi:MAG: lipoprotein signal peptidase [Chitinophagaceae bacterium]|nr:MAG: lipoprotein signal peptidase [Chitinophagaceae bacterium]